MSRFKESGKTTFGLFVVQMCNKNGITPKQFRDYAGYEQRSFQRMLSGHTRVPIEDFFWIVDALAELTEQNNGDLYDLILPQLTNIKYSKRKNK